MQSSGVPHLGNYLGMMKRTIELQENAQNECFFMIADLHSFTSDRSAADFKAFQTQSAIDWLSLGLNPSKVTFFRQSDVPAHAYAFWLLLTRTPMGLLERAHSYKDKTAKGISPNAGLFTYPVLMAVDILLYGAHQVPVGQDQKQHLEMTRDLAEKWNHHFRPTVSIGKSVNENYKVETYGAKITNSVPMELDLSFDKSSNTFKIPEAMIDEQTKVIPGTDGQKMSKSYGNTIPIFGSEKEIKKAVMKIKTESKNLGEKLNPETCNVMALHEAMGNPNAEKLKEAYRAGEIGFGESKKQLLAFIWEHFAPARAKREELLQNPQKVEAILQQGAAKAQAESQKVLEKMKKDVGLA